MLRDPPLKLQGLQLPALVHQTLVQDSPTDFARFLEDGLTLFCPWQIERLLNSAADLLDRSMLDRTRMIQLLASALDQQQDLERQQLQETQDRERLKGLEGTPSYLELSWARQKALAAQFDYISNGYKDALNGATNLATTNKYTDEVKRIEAGIEYARQRAASGHWLGDSAGLGNVVQREREEVDRQSVQISTKSEQLASRIGHTTSGGILDFGSEAELIAKRMRRDYEEALSRLMAALHGLEEILLCPISNSLDPAAPLSKAIPEASNLVRNLLHWHALRTQFDQGFTITVSVRHALKTSENWGALLAGTPIDLPFPAAAAAPWGLVRLRGISSARTGSAAGTCSLKLCAPKLAIRTDGKHVRQPRVPPCYLGRVQDISIPREPETAGAVTLMNVSPLPAPEYAWSIQLLSGSNAEIADIEVYFSCVGVPIESYE